MDGTVGVISAESGSTFWFELPLTAATSEPAEKNTTNNQGLSDVSALVVDPHRINRDTFVDMLADWGLVTHAAENQLSNAQKK